MDLLVGTFNTPHIYTLRFTPASAQTPSSLAILACTPAIGSHSWLALSPNKTHLYATAWTEPPSIAAYSLSKLQTSSQASDCVVPKRINNQPTASRSGYVCCSATHLYSAGGPSGEVFSIAPDGGVGPLVQTLSFVEEETSKGDGETRPHGDFGGLRHGAHSADLSPDGKKLYVADIGRNCVWAYAIADTAAAGGRGEHLVGGRKHVAPREGDGPRHAWPHPAGKMLYSLQEHSCMVDVFDCGPDGVSLEHVQGVRIIPEDRDEKMYWADEVRVSTERVPKYLYASTRGLQAETMGYVAVFALDESGLVKGDTALCIWETPTSGGWANAIEPAPLGETTHQGDAAQTEWLAMTDSEEGWVFVIGFDGTKVWEEARVKLKGDDGKVPGAATAVWL